jgi:hypothetical protein
MMSEGIPTGKTYLWFALKWNMIAVLVLLLCFILFKSDYAIAGFCLVMFSIFFFIRDSMRVGRRARKGLRRGYTPTD